MTSSVLVALRVKASPERTFDVFTREIAAWWRPDPLFRITSQGDGTLAFEGEAGGKLVTRLADGSVYEIGTITEWRRGERLGFTWKPESVDAERTTRVEVTFEAVGDAQLAAYRAQPRDSRPRVLDTGLWGWTRHPNYFGDACVWWGIWTLAGLGSGWLPGLLTVVAPVAMTHVLRNVTGAKLLERTMSQRPGWEEYAARVPLFFPRPPRS